MKNKLLQPFVLAKEKVLSFYFRQRMRELTSSRDKWKSKAMERQSRIIELEKQLHFTEEELKKNDF